MVPSFSDVDVVLVRVGLVRVAGIDGNGGGVSSPEPLSDPREFVRLMPFIVNRFNVKLAVSVFTQLTF